MYRTRATTLDILHENLVDTGELYVKIAFFTPEIAIIGEFSTKSVYALQCNVKLCTSVFQSWMGEITSNDNVKFTVLNLNQRLRPGTPVLSRVMVKFNPSMGSPRVRFIRLNGRKICPEGLSEIHHTIGVIRPPNRIPKSCVFRL